VTQSSENRSGLDDDSSLHQATCYLLVGASEGQLQLSARVHEGKLAALEIKPQGDFGGFIWDALASALVGVPLQSAPLREKIQAFERAGLIPQEISLAPLVSTLVKFGR
jgi:hypothetical protein